MDDFTRFEDDLIIFKQIFYKFSWSWVQQLVVFDTTDAGSILTIPFTLPFHDPHCTSKSLKKYAKHKWRLPWNCSRSDILCILLILLLLELLAPLDTYLVTFITILNYTLSDLHKKGWIGEACLIIFSFIYLQVQRAINHGSLNFITLGDFFLFVQHLVDRVISRDGFRRGASKQALTLQLL